MKDTDSAIDFVLLWVDSGDEKWIQEFNKYAPKENQIDIDISAERYRDYGLLKYWFRSVEKFAPWVRKIHFVTCAQKPEWLNEKNPKLNLVNHSDYIKSEYLPTFSSHPIELNMHKIKGLSEQFVYFNDDLFLTDFVYPDFFFKNGLPKSSAIQNIISCDGFSMMMAIVANDLREINANFKKRDVIKKNFFKWFNLKYGKDNLKNLILSNWKKFVGFVNPHFAQGFLKSEIEDCWAHCGEKLEAASRNRFRSADDVNQWLFRYWMICKGKFTPEAPYKNKKFFRLGDNTIEEICSAIKNQTFKEICINDGDDKNFEESKRKLQKTFEKILPGKSEFEK